MTRLETQIEQFKQTSPMCILCGRMPGFIGLFIVGNKKRFHVPEGKDRIIFYAACDDCIGKTREIEEVLECKISASLN